MILFYFILFIYLLLFSQLPSSFVRLEPHLQWRNTQLGLRFYFDFFLKIFPFNLPYRNNQSTSFQKMSWWQGQRYLSVEGKHQTLFQLLNVINLKLEKTHANNRSPLVQGQNWKV